MHKNCLRFFGPFLKPAIFGSKIFQNWPFASKIFWQHWVWAQNTQICLFFFASIKKIIIFIKKKTKPTSMDLNCGLWFSHSFYSQNRMKLKWNHSAVQYKKNYQNWFIEYKLQRYKASFLEVGKIKKHHETTEVLIWYLIH